MTMEFLNNPFLIMGANLLANNQPSPVKRGLGNIVGQSMLQAQPQLLQADQRMRQAKARQAAQAALLDPAGVNQRKLASSLFDMGQPDLALQTMGVGQKAGETWRPMTDAEKAAYGVPAGQAAQISNTGKISTPGAPMVNISQGTQPLSPAELGSLQLPSGDPLPYGTTGPQAQELGAVPKNKPTEKQQDVAGYLSAAKSAAAQLDSVEGWTPTGTWAASNKITRAFTSQSDRQAYDSQLAWTWNILRAESGGTVTKDEAEGQIYIYWPQPGDDDATKANKAALRASKMQAMEQRAQGSISSQPTKTRRYNPQTGRIE